MRAVRADAADRAERRPARHGDRRRSWPASTSSRLGFGVRAATGGDAGEIAVAVPARPPLRHHPRGRPDRGGRAGPRPRRAPAGDPARSRAARTAGASSAISGCCAGSRTCCATPGSTRRSPGASSIPTRGRRSRGLDHAEPVRVHNPLSADQSVMRTDLIGGLLDVAAHNLARGADRLALVRVGPRLPARGAADRGRSPRRAASRASGPRRSPSRTGSPRS